MSSWSDRRVVVTGMGVVSCLGQDPSTLWHKIASGACGIERVRGFDASEFDCQIAAEVHEFDPTAAFPTPKELRRTDRFTQFAVFAGAQALKDSGVDLNQVDLNEFGAFIGSGIGGLRTTEDQHKILLTKGPGRVSPFMIPMLILNMASGLFSLYYRLKGPNLATCSACATATHALGKAWAVIKRGDALLMAAGGTEATVVPFGLAGFAAMKAMSTRNDDPQHASRPFDRDRDGFVMGEGAGVLILEELEHAKRRGAQIYCELVGYGNTADACHMTAPDPEGEGAARAMNMALRHAGLAAEQIDYVNCHATSTPVGDVCETKMLKRVFGAHAHKLAASSTKGATGHMLGAAGAIETIICCKALEAQVAPPTINLENPDPECDLDYVPNTSRELRIDTFANNSFGFGGHNAILIGRRFVG